LSVKSALLATIPTLVHGFGTVAEPVPGFLEHDWNARKPQWKQVHGVATAEVRLAGQACGEVDALWSAQPKAWVGVVTADCVPILMSRRDGTAVAAIHAGWRGTLNRIVEATWNELGRAGHDPKDWVAAIGPCIQPCCFEVGLDVQENFLTEFEGQIPAQELNPRFRHLDIARLNQETLKRLGLNEVEVLRHCTKCETAPDGTYRFHSFRREKGGTRQLSIIGRVAAHPSG